MSHVKASKRRGSKKSSSVLTYTDANVAAARPVNDAFEPSKPRSRSQSIPQVLAEADIPPTRRRAATRASTEPSSTGLAPDVFQFLDREQSDADAHARKAAERRYTDQGANTRPSQQDHSRKASTTYSFRSDSGVSVRGHSPGRASSVASGDEYQPPTPPDVPLDTMKWGFGKTVRAKRPGPMAGAYLTDTESVFENPAASAPTLLDLSAPESFYYGKHLQKPSSSKRTMPQRPNIDTLKTAQQSRRPSQASASPKSSSTPKPPPESRPRIYRKFDALNHRLLRHLQEEITQLEEDLKTLDDLEAAHQASPETRNSPRQRMLAAKYHDLQIQDYSVLHYKRTDLLEKIAVKTEQYNRTLCSFNKVVQTLSPPTEDDLETYRSSLTASASSTSPLTKGDRRILDHKSDLVLIAPSRSIHKSGHGSPDPNPMYTSIAAICAAILFPLLAFGAISEFFGRIVIVAIIGGMIALWASHGSSGHEYLIEPRDGWKCAVLYFGFMSIAAVLIT